jgi:hypothetical protein
MGALEIRACIHAGDDLYLCPLSKIQLPPAVLTGYLAPVWTGEQALSVIHRPQLGGTAELIAEGFERLEPMIATVAAGAWPRPSPCWAGWTWVTRSKRRLD